MSLIVVPESYIDRCRDRRTLVPVSLGLFRNSMYYYYEPNYYPVVSTYSLVYTTTYAYLGGVLAPNGDIHFVPHSANRGQKISPEGVVSTYGLVYTTAKAYAGGALAPNGDIHFVPRSASVGQKISSEGVVSIFIYRCPRTRCCFLF